MKTSTDEHFAFLLRLLTFFLGFQPLCSGTDVINTTRAVVDGETVVSSGGSFELGFFQPAKSQYRYLGIWYRRIAAFTVVWVANRDNPVTNTSGAVLKVVHPGILAVINGNNSIVWSSNTSRVARAPIAQLLDNGNLVLKEADDNDPENYLWQSFDNPTDTLLPGMKLGHLPTGRENYLSSWKSSDDPGTGSYTCRLDPTGYPQLVLRKDSVKLFRTGPWNGLGYSGLPGLKNNSIYTFKLVMRGRAVYYQYELAKKATVSRFMMNQSGEAQRWVWIETQGWIPQLRSPTDNCDSYNQCRAYGICNVLDSPTCGCLKKFVPKFPEAWAAADWSEGCVRGTPLNCKTDGFVKYYQVKLPDTTKSWFNRSMTPSECEAVCRKNCSCTAYTTLDIRNGGSGCLFWSGELLDISQVNGAGQDLLVRMASSELDIVAESRKRNRKVLIGSLSSVAAIIILMISFAFCICKRKKYYLKLRRGDWNREHNCNLELPVFDLSKIARATNSFALSNKLGEGGFGPVYKGTLENDQEIAVKRLSKTSFQGPNEFKNEVICIARLQHRNLVKLLGCCIEGDEKMLIYEYMPNKSLDLILFDETKCKQLDWPKRYHIIIGVARGLLYLHQDSRLRIIHRDLKVGNILLDADMNPKISDFGMARIFGGNETEANTNRVVGTYGYISPEYSSHGMFSTKSDVFSFGVIMLEILSGQRIRGFSHERHHHNLLGHAWVLHKEGKSLELVQDTLVESRSLPEVLRSIHVGLLCVQAHPEDRPSMSSVVSMLENDVVLPMVRQPGFFIEEYSSVNDNSASTNASSKNEVTVTMLEPR